MVVEIKNAIELANDKGNLRTYQEGKENNQNFNWGEKNNAIVSLNMHR